MPSATRHAIDRRALKALFDTYWSRGGWHDEARSTPSEELEHAKRAGVMFDAIEASHDDIVARVIAAVKGVERRAVADAFVVSLSTRRLDLRSALGSFAVFQHFTAHPSPPAREKCPVCGEDGGAARPRDQNVLSFERFKWGGVRHGQPLYASLDLELLRQQPRVEPSPADVDVLEGVLRAIEAAPPETTAATLQKLLVGTFESSKSERDVVVAILGLCGVLGTADHPGHRNQFVPVSARELPARRYIDMAYPACWWRRADGIDQQALAAWFGHLLA
jgi:hypothetical protein